MNKHLSVRTSILAASLLLAAASTAQAAGYVAVAGGVSKFDVDCTGTSSCDTTGSALRLTGGWRFANGLAAEAWVTDFGKAKARDSGIDVAIKARAIGAGGAYHLDMGAGFGLVLRLGVASVKLEGEGRSGPFVATVSESSTKPYAGVGGTWSFSPQAYLEAGLDSTQGKIGGDNGTLRSVTLGIGVRF